MTKTIDPELEEFQTVLDELQRYEEEVRAEFETVLEHEAVQQEAAERWAFAGGWHTREEIRRLRRRAWSRWVVVRVEALALVGFTLFLALGVMVVLFRLLPQ